MRILARSRRLSIQPGEQRNDFYVMIDCGEFLQDRKRTAKNVELSVAIRDSKGKEIEVNRLAILMFTINSASCMSLGCFNSSLGRESSEGVEEHCVLSLQYASME